MSAEIPFEIHADIISIKADVKRLLEHSERMFEKQDSFAAALHEEALLRQQGDREIELKCEENIKSIYRNVAIGGLGIIMTMIGSFFVWIIDKFKSA